VTGTEEAEAEAEEENQKMYFRPPPKAPEWYAGDAETGQAARPLYPLMLEDPRLRWAFIRKVYSILSIQMLLTVAVAAIVVYVRPVARFFVSTPGGFGLYIFLIILPFIGTRHNLWLDFDLLID
jgi:hypothetical protein